MRIAIAFDHAGVPLREAVAQAVTASGHEPVDLGVDDDYPDTALKAADAILDGSVERAIIVCGSGAGVVVAACKVPRIRAACGHDTYTAAQCVSHDDCNVLCLGARVIGSALAAECVKAFCNAKFSGAERHVRRLKKIESIERNKR